MTAYGSIQDAVAAMKEGALDFLAKPVDPDHLLLLVDRALAQRRLVTEYLLLKEELASRRGCPEIVGDAPVSAAGVAWPCSAPPAATRRCCSRGRAAPGKELFARALHALSARRDGPFVAINCAAIPENLLETELFGHEKGAFTGAVARKPGKFELAHRGTIFLDEIGDLPLPLQAKILRGARGTRVRARRRHRDRAGGRARGGGDQPQPARGGGGAAVPRGPVLPPVGVPDHRPAAARAARGHPAARPALHRPLLPGDEEAAR